MTMEVKKILQQVHELLSEPSRWNRGASARDVWGNQVDPKCGEAVCFCLIGAVEHVAPGLGEQQVLVRELYQVYREMCPHEPDFRSNFTACRERLMEWNDGTANHDDVLRLIQAAKALP